MKKHRALPGHPVPCACIGAMAPTLATCRPRRKRPAARWPAWQRSGPGGKVQREAGAAAEGIVDGQAAAMGGEDAADDGEAEAGAFALAAIGAPEALDHAAAQLRRHAGAAVADMDGGLARDLDLDLGARRCVLERVLDQIAQGL